MKTILHKSCETLPIYNFYKIVDSDNLNYLVVNFDDLDDVKIEIDPITARLNWNDILTEYAELTANKKILNNYEKQIEIVYLEAIINAGEKILENYNEFEDIEILLLLNKFDYAFDKTKNIENQINMVIRKIKGYRNKVRILKANYANKNKKVKEEVKSNLSKDALSLELSLDIGREIDIRRTTVSKWVYMIEIMNERAKDYANLKK